MIQFIGNAVFYSACIVVAVLFVQGGVKNLREKLNYQGIKTLITDCWNAFSNLLLGLHADPTQPEKSAVQDQPPVPETESSPVEVTHEESGVTEAAPKSKITN